MTPKHLRQNLTIDSNQLADLLVAKDKELKNELKLAAEQQEVQKKMNALKTEVDKNDEEIRQLQKHLKEAEHILVCLLVKIYIIINLFIHLMSTFRRRLYIRQSKSCRLYQKPIHIPYHQKS